MFVQTQYYSDNFRTNQGLLRAVTVTVHVLVVVPSAAVTIYFFGEEKSPGTPNVGAPSAGLTDAAVEIFIVQTMFVKATFALSVSVKEPPAEGTLIVAVTVFA